MKNHKAFVEGFIDILIKRNIIQRDKAEAIKIAFYKREKPLFVNFLLTEGLITRGDILNALSEYFQVPAFDVVGYFFEHDLLHKFPKDVLLRNAMIPLEVDDEDILIMIASEPNREDLLALIGEYVSYQVQFMVGIVLDITDAVEEFYDLSVSQEPQDSDIKEEQRERHEAEEILEQEREENE